MKRRADEYDEEDLMLDPDMEGVNAAVAGFRACSERGEDTGDFVRRFCSDEWFRRRAVPVIAADIHIEPPPESFTALERASDEDAMTDEAIAIEDAFTARRPTAEQRRIRAVRWTYAMRKYGLPAVNFRTWQVR